MHCKDIISALHQGFYTALEEYHVCNTLQGYHQLVHFIGGSALHWRNIISDLLDTIGCALGLFSELEGIISALQVHHGFIGVLHCFGGDIIISFRSALMVFHNNTDIPQLHWTPPRH